MVPDLHISHILSTDLGQLSKFLILVDIVTPPLEKDFSKLKETPVQKLFHFAYQKIVFFSAKTPYSFNIRRKLNSGSENKA